MRKIFTFLFAALMSVGTGAMAQEEILLTTLTFGGSDTYGETTSGVVNVTATNVGSYNGTYGWLLDEGGSLSVTAKEGYTITKCVFRQNAKTPITDTEAPFEIHTNYWGGIIEDPEEEMDGVTSIEVYGYATPTTHTLQLVADPTMGSVVVTNLLGSDIVDNGNGNYTVPENAKVTILATPNEGYVFTGWLEGNVLCDFIDCGTALNTLDNPLTFTLTQDAACKAEFAAVAPQPEEVTVVFAANDKTVERTVTLPHTFKCDWAGGMERPDELDIIIHELYNDYFYCNSNMNASGSDQVEVGTEKDPKNDYITIKGVFEGTATVTGNYLDYVDDNYGEHNYSITITIKGDEPEPLGVENVQTNPVQTIKFFRDGQLLIEKNGKIYNVQGVEVK